MNKIVLLLGIMAFLSFSCQSSPTKSPVYPTRTAASAEHPFSKQLTVNASSATALKNLKDLVLQGKIETSNYDEKKLEVFRNINYENEHTGDSMLDLGCGRLSAKMTRKIARMIEDEERISTTKLLNAFKTGKYISCAFFDSESNTMSGAGVYYGYIVNDNNEIAVNQVEGIGFED